MTVDVSGAALTAIVDYFREVSGLNVSLDEDGITDEHSVTIRLQNISMRRIFDIISLDQKLEYDVRFGVLLVSTPERLWGKPKAETPVVPLNENQSKAARDLVALLAKESPEEREKAANDLLKLGRAAIPILTEGANGKDKAVAAHCKDLIDRLSPKLLAGGIPREATFRSQKLAKAGADILKKLNAMKLELSFVDAELADIVAFLRDATGINFMIEKGVEKKIGELKAKDLTVGQSLELLALTRGLDAKIEGGVVVIFSQKK